MPKKHSYEFVKTCFENEGCTLLSSEYTNSGSKLKYLCKNGHKHQISFGHFSRGHRCSECAGIKKLTYEHVNKYFENEGCSLLSSEYTNSSSKLKYLCKNGHESETSYNSFSQGHGCMKCYSERRKHDYEFINRYFEDQGFKLLSMEYNNNNGKLKYLCKNGHESQSMFRSIVSGHGCKKCLNKTENFVLEFLQGIYVNIISEARFEWCKNKNPLPFDFLLDNEKVLIEIDGRQHFEHVPYWKTNPEYQQKRDVYKMSLAVKHGYRIIRICQEDIFKNTIDWQGLLIEAIGGSERIVYISANPELYAKHQIMMDILPQ